VAAAGRGGQHIEVPVADHLASVVAHAAGPAGRDDPRAAVASLSEALVLTGERIGTDHPEVLAATRVLAALHKQLGELPEARSLLENAIAAGQFTRGERDPVMLGLAFDLAHVAHELENRHEARRNFERVRRYGPAVLGPEHEYVRVAQRYLGGPPAGGTSAPVAAPQVAAPGAAVPVAAPPVAAAPVVAAPVAAPPVAAPHPATVAPPPPGATRPIGRVPIQQIPMPPPVPVAPAPAPTEVPAQRATDGAATAPPSVEGTGRVTAGARVPAQPTAPTPPEAGTENPATTAAAQTAPAGPTTTAAPPREATRPTTPSVEPAPATQPTAPPAPEPSAAAPTTSGPEQEPEPPTTPEPAPATRPAGSTAPTEQPPRTTAADPPPPAQESEPTPSAPGPGSEPPPAAAPEPTGAAQPASAPDAAGPTRAPAEAAQQTPPTVAPPGAAPPAAEPAPTRHPAPAEAAPTDPPAYVAPPTPPAAEPAPTAPPASARSPEPTAAAEPPRARTPEPSRDLVTWATARLEPDSDETQRVTPAEREPEAAPQPILIAPLRPVPAHRHATAPAQPPRPKSQPKHQPSDQPKKRSRAPLIVLAVILSLAVLGGSAALVVAFLSSDRRPDRRADPSASVPSAIRLSLDDRGATVNLSWTDPSRGTVPFVVSFGRADGPADRTEQVAAGTTTLAVNQLTPTQDYCFTVEVGDPAAGVAPSPTVCTNRPRPSASPGR